MSLRLLPSLSRLTSRSSYLRNVACIPKLQSSPSTSYRIRSIHNSPSLINMRQITPISTQHRSLRLTSFSRKVDDEGANGGESSTMWSRFKKMVKQYWYVVVPIDLIVTGSCLTGFYMLSASGFDVITYMKTASFMPESGVVLLDKVPAAAGHFAVALVLLKISFPIRMLVVAGVSGLTIRLLSRYGFITSRQIQTRATNMYNESEMKERLRLRRVQMQKYMARKRAASQFYSKPPTPKNGNGNGNRKIEKDD